MNKLPQLLKHNLSTIRDRVNQTISLQTVNQVKVQPNYQPPNSKPGKGLTELIHLISNFKKMDFSSQYYPKGTHVFPKKISPNFIQPFGQL